MLDGDLVDAEVHFRAAAEGFARIDRPVMLSMTLDVVAEFDERSGDYAAAGRALDTAIATNEACGLRGFTGSLFARRGWVLLHEGELVRAEAMYQRALEGARRLGNAPVMVLALTGMAVLHRLHGRDSDADRSGHRSAAALPSRALSPVQEPHRPHARPPGRRRSLQRGARGDRGRRQRTRAGGGSARAGRAPPRRRRRRSSVVPAR